MGDLTPIKINELLRDILTECNWLRGMLERHGMGTRDTPTRSSSTGKTSKFQLESSASSVATRDSINTKSNESTARTSIGSANPLHRLTINGRVKDPFGFFQTDDPSSPIVKPGLTEAYEDWLAKAEARDRDQDRRGPDPDSIEVIQDDATQSEPMHSSNLSVVTGTKSLRTFKSVIKVHEPLPENLSDVFPKREKVKATERMRGRYPLHDKL